MSNDSSHTKLKREVGLLGAILLGLGSILGTGVFVSISLATQATGASILLAVALAALVATCNGLNSAQLAANHPVSGGTYEYGYRYLSPSLGFGAGWMFLCAKSASAATAALGFTSYFFGLLDVDNTALLIPITLAALVIVTSFILAGLRRSNVMNAGIVAVTLIALLLVVTLTLTSETSQGRSPSLFTFEQGLPGFLEASALIFVAYTGYGRIATLGEEVKDPRTTIPRAMIATLLVSMVIYAGVALAVVTSLDLMFAESLEHNFFAPLALIAGKHGGSSALWVVSLGATMAMLGVLLNLILGLSRVWLAMARRGDMPKRLSHINASGTTPTPAVMVTSLVIGGLILIGDIKMAWSLSAFTVLLYYALTNLCALRLNRDERLYPRSLAYLGLAACLFLAFWVEPRAWITGLALLFSGYALRALLKTRK